MAFPTTLTNAVDGVTEIVAAHLNNLEAKVGIDGSAVPTSLDYLVKNAGSINPGHKHSKLWASDGDPEAVTVDAAGQVGLGIATPDRMLHLYLGDSGYSGQAGYDWTPLILENSDHIGFQLLCPADKTANIYFGCPGYPAAGYIQYQCANNALLLGVGSSQLFYSASGLAIGTNVFGTNAAKVISVQFGTAPTTAPADRAQMWVEDINAAAGKAGWHMMAESGTGKLIVAGVLIKGTTGDPAQVHEGLMCINTADNNLKMYCEGGWRQLASWT